MSARHCRRGRVPFLPDAVEEPRTVVSLFEQLVDVDGEPQTVALLIDRRGHALTAMQRAGDVSPNDLFDLCAVCSGAGDADEIELLIVASWRPGTWAQLQPGDDDCWFGMLERTSGGDVHLVDWLLIDGSDVTSIATECGR